MDFIKHDPLSLGALVTTHKIDLLAACRDMFDELDLYARFMGEISSISKRDSKLIGHAKDPISNQPLSFKFSCKQADIPIMLGHHFGMFDFNTVNVEEAERELEQIRENRKYFLVKTGVKYVLSM